MKRVYAVASQVQKGSRHWLTPGKEYLADEDVTHSRGEGFEITDDTGGRAYCLWVGCQFLGGSWTRIEREEPDEKSPEIDDLSTLLSTVANFPEKK